MTGHQNGHQNGHQGDPVEEVQPTPVQAPGVAHEQELASEPATSHAADAAGVAGVDEDASEVGAPRPALSIARFPEKLALVRLGPGTEIPGWAESSSIFSVTATATETAILCAGRNVPTKARGIKPLIAFSVPGPVDFVDGAAVLVDLLAPLVEQGIAATTTASVESRWILVPAEQANRAEQVWKRRGHTVAPAVPAR